MNLAPVDVEHALALWSAQGAWHSGLSKTSTDRIRLDELCRQPNIVPGPTRAYLYRSLDTMARQSPYTRNFEYGARYKERSRSARTSPKVQNESIANDPEECHSL
jgi:hypothetical protein